MISSPTIEGSAGMDATMQKTAHEDLHSEHGAARGDRPDRAANPVIKVEGLAWLEFEKPDLDAAERFAHDFGLATAYRTDNELHLRGTLPGSQSVLIRRGPRSRLVAGGPPAPRAGHRHGRPRAPGPRRRCRRRPRGPGGHPGAGRGRGGGAT